MKSPASSPGRLAVPVAVLALVAGCNGGTASPGGGSGSGHSISAKVPTPAKPGTSPPKSTSKIEGDRLADLAPVVPNQNIPQDPSPFRFTDITKEAGIDFVEVSGMESATKHFPTANGSGVALFDYDGDGKLDIYFATGTYLPRRLPQDGPEQALQEPRRRQVQGRDEGERPRLRGVLPRHHRRRPRQRRRRRRLPLQLRPERPLPQQWQRHVHRYQQESGHRPRRLVVGRRLLDYDNDGDLDIYVANYGRWKLPEDDIFCGDKEKNVRLYCNPRLIKTTKHFFYRNNGDGTFTDVYDKVIYDPVSKALRGRDDGHGFGVVACDIDLDGKIDLWVANDMNPNFTFLNKGEGKFEDITDTAGASLNLNGQTQSGMGVDAEDVNGDGLPELFVTNFSNEPDTLYQNLGKASFLDTTTFFGLAADSMPYVKWGTGLFDFDGDGWPDCFVTNGHVDDNRKLLGQDIDYEEPPLLHRNIDGRRFKLSTRDVGPYFDGKHVGRGAAFGDLDNDGDIDIVVNHKDAPPAVLRNDTPMNGNTWIRLDLVGTKSNRDAIGTLIKVQVGPRTIWRQRKGGCSMESTNDGRVLIGLGKAPLVDKITLRWPSGTEQVLENVRPNQALKVVEPRDGVAAGGAK